MYLDAHGCTCRICRLSARLRQRVVDSLFRDILLENYGADITRVWKRENSA